LSRVLKAKELTISTGSSLVPYIPLGPRPAVVSGPPQRDVRGSQPSRGNGSSPQAGPAPAPTQTDDSAGSGGSDGNGKDSPSLTPEDGNTLRAEAYQEAYEEGREQGLTEGYDEGHRKGLDEGYQAGLEQGLKEGRQTGLKEGMAQARSLSEGLLSDAEAKLRQAEEDYNSILASLKPEIIRLALAVGRRVAGRMLHEDPQGIIGILREALSEVKGGRAVLRLNPDDAGVIGEHRRRLLSEFPSISEILVEEDEAIKAGGCMVQTETGEIDCRIDQRFSLVEEALLEVMDQ